MQWIKKHVDTVIFLGGIVASVSWMNHKFSEINEKFNEKFSAIDYRFSEIEKEMAIIKTILLMKNILPAELAKDMNSKVPNVGE